MSRYILTDMGNILTRFKLRPNVIGEILAGFGVATRNWAKLPADPVAPHEEGWYHGLDLGMFSLYDVWKQLTAHGNIPETACPFPLFVSLWCRHLEPIEGVARLYQRLQQEFPLVVISNGDSEGVRHIAFHLADVYGLRFRKVFISGEYGRKKPDLFNDVLAFLYAENVNPADCVFVDDIEAYVDAATKIGIPAIQFDGSKQDASVLKEALVKLGFSVE